MAPLVGKTEHHIQDSVDMVNKLKNITLPPGYSLTSFDLTEMFTRLPQGHTLELLRQRLESDPDLSKRTALRINDIMALVTLDLDLAYFCWGGCYYKQLKGFGMGKSTSSPLSDIYMEDFEEAALANYPTGDNSIRPSDVILFWLRKADDTLVAIHNDHIHPLHNYLNSIHPDIKWTIEVEQDRKIAMLDVTIIHNPNGSLSFDVYRKPTHTNQYIPFNSHQPLAHKLSTIHALTRRAALIPSTEAPKKG